MSFLALTACLFSLAPAKITSATAFCENEAKQLGKSLSIPPEMGRQILYVEPAGLSGVPLLRQVAQALNAEVWVSDTEIRFGRSATYKRELDAQLAALRQSWIRNRITSIENFEAKRGPMSKVVAYDRALSLQQKHMDEFLEGRESPTSPRFPSENLPLHYLLRGLVQKIGIAKFAEVPAGQTAIYSTSPVGSQIKLPSCDALIATYEKEMAPFRERFKPPEEEPSLVPTNVFKISPKISHVPIHALRLLVRSTGNRIMILVEAYDLAGNRVETAAISGGPTDATPLPRAILAEAQKKDRQSRLKLTPIAAEQAKFLSTSVSETFPTWFQRPKDDEPLRYLAGEAIVGLRGTPDGKPFIFNFSDSLLNLLPGFVSGDTLHVGALREGLRIWCPYEKVQTDNGTVWRPVDPLYAEQRASDRTQLTDFFRAFRPETGANWNTLFRLMGGSHRTVDALSQLWLGRAYDASRLSHPPRSSLGTDFLRVLATIPDAAWRDLRMGESRTLGQLGIFPLLQSYMESHTPLQSRADISAWDAAQMECGLSESDHLSIELSSRPLGRAWKPSDPEPRGFLDLGLIAIQTPISPKSVRWKEDIPEVPVSLAELTQTFATLQVRTADQEIMNFRISRQGRLLISGMVQGPIINFSGAQNFGSMSEALRAEVLKVAAKRAIYMAQQDRNVPSEPFNTPVVPATSSNPPPP